MNGVGIGGVVSTLPTPFPRPPSRGLRLAEHNDRDEERAGSIVIHDKPETPDQARGYGKGEHHPTKKAAPLK